MVVAIQLKNKTRKAFGSNDDYVDYAEKKQGVDATAELLPEDDPANKIDDAGRNLLQ